jgi:dGTPase
MTVKTANARSLAAYASDPDASRGRRHAEPESATRSVFQRDRDRIVHSGAFRRLQYKTQVFVYHEGDYFRTRLTHSLEVAQITRSICRQLSLNEDLAEAVALAHDLGHTPFGHAGEEELSRQLKAAGAGSFDHNVQTFRILTSLEHRYAGFDGLNLTWESLEGVVKHNGPVRAPAPELTAFCRDFDLELATHAGPEAQVAALGDDIAYDNHDIDDGLRAGLFTLAELEELELVGPVLAEVRRAHPDIDEQRLIHEAVRRLIDRMVGDLLSETERRLHALAPESPGDVRQAAEPVVAFSDAMRQKERALRQFLFQRMYRHFKVNRMTQKVRRVVRELFEQYTQAPNCLPQEWRLHAEALDAPQRARVIGDYIAGMTDRYAIEEHRKLFDVTAAT